MPFKIGSGAYFWIDGVKSIVYLKASIAEHSTSTSAQYWTEKEISPEKGLYVSDLEFALAFKVSPFP